MSEVTNLTQFSDDSLPVRASLSKDSQIKIASETLNSLSQASADLSATVTLGRIPSRSLLSLLTDTPWVARHGLTSQQYQAEFNKWVGQGYRLTTVSGYEVNNRAYYAAIWVKVSGPTWIARHGMSSSQYQSEFNKWAGQGYRLTHIDGYTINNQDRYAAIWVKMSGPAWVARHRMSSSQYQSEFNKYVGQGFRLTSITGYTVDNQPRYAAIWEKTTGPTWQARHELTSAQYQSVFNSLVSQGYRPSLVNGYTVDNQDRYACIFIKQGGRELVARHRMTSAEYQGEFNNFKYQGYRLQGISGYEIDGQSRYAALWESHAMKDADLRLIDGKIQSYRSKHGVLGLSLAIAKDERLVYAEGYGYANVSTGEKVNPHHRFRIASISKPITAVAIMDLVEHGKLQLDGQVFGRGAILGEQYGTSPYSNSLQSITVRHLLQHTSGLPKNDSNDPMFMHYKMDHAALIGWVLDNRGVENEPGTTYGYSNFGYCVLGRIIEAVTGQPYESYLRNVVLKQCGISQMRIGGDTLTEKAPNEVVHYDKGAYGMKVRRMDANGGWIASPIDLLRFMVRTDGFDSKADILFPATEDTMFSGSDTNTSYGLGWIVSSFRGHNGSMPGTIGFLVRRDDGYSFAVLVNKRPAEDASCFELKGVLDSIVTSVSLWPSHDLF